MDGYNIYLLLTNKILTISFLIIIYDIQRVYFHSHEIEVRSYINS